MMLPLHSAQRMVLGAIGVYDFALAEDKLTTITLSTQLSAQIKLSKATKVQ